VERPHEVARRRRYPTAEPEGSERQGWARVAAAIHRRWQAGDRDGATALVTDEMVLGTTLIGTAQMVSERLRVWRDAGVDSDQ
jgi:hypothetical protein